jgi:hypothetical protein
MDGVVIGLSPLKRKTDKRKRRARSQMVFIPKPLVIPSQWTGKRRVGG